MLRGLTLFKCGIQENPSDIHKHISSSTNDEIEEEEDIERFEPVVVDTTLP
jgi:hypothetical protein